MTETQATICDWADSVFGPVSSNLRVAARANEEMAELLRCLSMDEAHPKAGEECADVYIVLCRLATRLGVDLTRELADWPNHRSLDDYPAAELAAAANHTMAALLLSLVATDSVGTPTAKSLLGSVVCRLADAARRLGVDLQAAVAEKMACNKARTWKLDGSGHGYHVKDQATEG